MPFRWLSSRDIVLAPLPEFSAQVRPASFSLLRNEIARHSPACVFEPELDSAYFLVPSSLLRSAISWTFAELHAQGVGYTANSWDCDDFAAELCQVLRKCAARAGIKVAPLVGQLAVFQQNGWANVAPGGYHAVVAVLTDAGVLIVESQNGETVLLDSYSNRNHIFRARGF